MCNNDVETVISAHIRDGVTGRSIKASDISTASCCHKCHEIFDRRAKLPSGEYLSDAEWLFYALRGLQETLEQRYAAGLLIVPVDPEKPSQTISRKPKGQRKPIPKPVDTVWAKRKLRGRKFGA